MGLAREPYIVVAHSLTRHTPIFAAMPRLSLIICRYRDEHFDRLLANLDATLATGAERIVIDNRAGDYDIFSAYNEGIRRSTGEILCFLHEDLTFPERGWDRNALAHFDADPGLGMIGVAGGASATVLPRSWTHTYYPHDYARAVIEQDGAGVYGRREEGFRQNTKQALLLDGIWFCVRRSLIEAHGLRFDESHYKGFHRYDFDFSMQVAQVARLAIVRDICPQHYSVGHRRREWLQASLDFQRKWNDVLPCRVVEGQVGIERLPFGKTDRLALVRFAMNMRKLGFARAEIDEVFDMVLGESRLPWELRAAGAWVRAKVSGNGTQRDAARA